MGTEEFVVMETPWEEMKTKSIRDSKILKKKFNYLVSEIYLQTNDCLGPEGNGKHKQNEVRQDSDASCCLGFKFYLHSFSAVPRG